MATTQVLHGRREGQIRGTMGENPVSIIPSGIDAHEVTVLQPNDWKRIQDVLSKTNYEAQRQEAVKKEREELHNISKNMVKNWGNTIEGQRLKKLEARKIKEDKEEEEKKLTDIEEAKFQAQKRKEAIERAKTLQYHKTDRVKGFHSALLLTEVLRERDAQVKMKSNQAEATKSRDDYLIEVQRKQYEEGVLQDQEKALKRYNARQKISEFQKLQVNEKDEKKIEEKELDFAEGANIKEQVAMYKAAKQTIVDQRRQQKRSLMDSHKKTMRERQMYMEKERQKDEEENEEIRQFASAKKKMSKMRKEKEVELFNTFQEQTERMRSKLAVEMKQKVDDEDDRLAKAVAERDDKMAKEEQVKQEAELISRKSIHQHRIDTIKEKERKVTEDLDMDKHLLKLRIESDEKHKKEEEIKLTVQRGHAKKLQNVHEGQKNEKVNRKKGEVKENLIFDHENSRLMAEEEKYFQDYASRVLSEQKIKDPSGNHFPLIKAADEGPGGGRGPRFEGKSGYRPSYIVCDSTGVQLPNYSQETAARSKIRGRPGQSFKRLGLNW